MWQGITKWDKHYEVRSNILFFFSTRLRKHTRILIWSAYSLIQTINRNILIKWNPWSHFTGLYFPEFKLNMEIYPVHLHIHSECRKVLICKLQIRTLFTQGYFTHCILSEIENSKVKTNCYHLYMASAQTPSRSELTIQ